MIAKKALEELVFFVVGGVLGLVVLLTIFWQMSKDLILPGVRIVGEEMSFKSRTEAKELLTNKIANYTAEVNYGGNSMNVPPDIYDWEVDETVERAVETGRTVNPLRSLELLFGKTNLELTVNLDQEQYASWSAEIETLVAIPGKAAELNYGTETTKIQNGEDEVSVDRDKLAVRLLDEARKLTKGSVEIPIQHIRYKLTPEEEQAFLTKVNALRGKTLILGVGDDKVRLSPKEMASLLSLTPPTVGQVSNTIVEEYVEGLSTRYNREAQDAKFEFADGKVQEFAPARNGIELVVGQTVEVLNQNIEKLIRDEEKVLETKAILLETPPLITTESVNNLGIVERIGRGESYYAHSIPNRVYNVGLASSRISGALIPPGSEFSFNSTVGDISSATGYRTAYVIQNGRTELGDGGGVCQVSTTLFRAVMNAGLPITERWPHAYRVGYYEQDSKPGFDATIFSPSKDFKFLNDTPGHLLIQVINNPSEYHLVFEIYGTSDGRVSTVSEARVSGISPPPPDLYQDDPTLPAGTVRQVDWAAWGAKSAFDYKVERGGETIFAKTFNSSYRPWANVYLRGTMGL